MTCRSDVGVDVGDSSEYGVCGDMSDGGSWVYRVV